MIEVLTMIGIAFVVVALFRSGGRRPLRIERRIRRTEQRIKDAEVRAYLRRHRH